MSGTEIAGNHLDTVSHQWNSVGYWVESVSGGGRYWNYDLTDPVRAWPDNGALLTMPKRYAQGPCAGQNSQCRFQADDRREDEDGQRWELVVTQNKLWVWHFPPSSEPFTFTVSYTSYLMLIP